MRFPKRTAEHITETRSWRILSGLAPDEWIVRDISERDYGIDAYIEIASASGDITGNLISVQLKGTKTIAWKDNNSGKSKTAASPPIDVATASYWLNLPVPVFLFVADLAVRNIYFASVEPQIRNHFDKLNQQDTLSFKLLEDANLLNGDAGKLINLLAARERFHPQFAVYITSLLGSIESFGHFILYNQGYDIFMEVDSERHLQFRTIYECCQMAAVVLGIPWPIEPLAGAYERDREHWKSNYCYLHEETLDSVLQQLQKIFPKLVRKAIKLITEAQSAYWFKRERLLFTLCVSGDIERMLQRFEQESGGL